MNKKYIQAAILSIVGILFICGCMQTSKNTKDSTQESEQETVDTLHIPQVGEKAVDRDPCLQRNDEGYHLCHAALCGAVGQGRGV